MSQIVDMSDAWRPPRQQRVSEWADESLRLDPLVNADGGRYRSAQTPYAREWMDCANRAWVRHVSIVAGTQIGKTTTLNAVLGYAIAQDPGPIMVVVPRTTDIPTFFERRLMPLVEQSPALAAELTDRAHDTKRREILFRRAIVYVRASQSPADLASVPVRYLFADEVDKYPGWSGREASPLDLARERQRTFWNSIQYDTSTPTTPDGAIWKEFEDGDRRRFFVPCPHCGEFQVLRWERVRFNAALSAKEMRERREAHYECERCSRAIDDASKRGMLERGVWCPESVPIGDWRSGAADSDRADHRSYHLWAAYSPWLTWWQLAAQFLTSKDDPARMQNWVNSWLGEPWVDRVESLTDDAVSRCVVPGLRTGSPPPEVIVATAGVDVQKDRVYYVIRGWGCEEESWLLAYGQVATFAELEDVLFRQQWCSARGGSGVVCGLIDSRYRRDEVIEFVRRRPAMRPSVGVDREGPVDFTTNRLDKHPRTGAPLPNSVLIWSVTVGRFKDLVSSRMHRPDSWHLPEDIDEHYRRQVSSEHKIRVRSGARETSRWVLKPGSKANHLWDCEVYAVAAAKLIKVEQLRRPAGDGPASRPAPRPRPTINRMRAGMPLLGE